MGHSNEVSLGDLSRAEGGLTDPLLGDDDSTGSRGGSPRIPAYLSNGRPLWRRVVGRFDRGLLFKLLIVATVFLLGYTYAAHEKGEEIEAVHEMTDIRIMGALLAERYPLKDGDPAHAQRQRNLDAIDRLASCTESETCTDAEKTVVILASHHFGNALAGRVSGENIWGISTINAFQALNHTVLITFNYMEALTMYQTLRDHVAAVIWEAHFLQMCLWRNETTAKNDPDGKWQRGAKGCIQRPEYLEGIPLWKSFAFHFWNGVRTPLGWDWTVSPEDYRSFSDHGPQFLGYSIEDRCVRDPVHEQRAHRALVLAKEPKYFKEGSSEFVGKLGPAAAMVPAIKDAAGHDVPFEITSTAGPSTENGTKPPAEISEKGVTVVGRLPQAEWAEYMASSKALIGVGHPMLSPSPYEALCRGVPFINPIKILDRNDPTNRDKWLTQHDGLKYIEEPYVYHVPRGDAEALGNALRKAADTPIGRFIPPKMRRQAVIDRHAQLLAQDWLAKCKAYVAENYDEDAPERKWFCMDAEDIRQVKLRIPQ